MDLYKNSSESFQDTQKQFFEKINQGLSDCFENIIKDHDFELFSERDFCDMLSKASEALESGDFENLVSILQVIMNQFLIPQKEIQHVRCKIFQQSLLCHQLMAIIDQSCYCHLFPYILQLFINILAFEDGNSFVIFNLDKNGIEVVMHHKKTMPERYLPLVFMYAYNIYSHCSEYIINETTELLDYINLCEKLINSDVSSNYFLIPLAIINILRKEKVEEEQLPENFFTNLIYIAESKDTRVSIFPMWCLYFYFKNNYNYTYPSKYINKNLINLLTKKIMIMNDLTETKIAMYILAICLSILEDKKKHKFLELIPINQIINLMNIEEKEISALSIILCHNIIALCPLYIEFLVENHAFDNACEIAKNGPLNCKSEAGFLIINLIRNCTKEMKDQLLNPDILTIIIDLIQVNNNELSISICGFIINYMPIYPWIASFLLNENFDYMINSLQELSDNLPFINAVQSILKVLDYKRNKAYQ